MTFLDHLENEFRTARKLACQFVETHNEKLPLECQCGCDSTVPGLPCPDCSHVADTPWAILLDTEFGYDVVALGDRNDVIARFNVED